MIGADDESPAIGVLVLTVLVRRLQVDFREFLDLVRLSASGADVRPSSVSSTVAARMGDNPEVARHEQMLAYRAARALTRKIIRAHMPSPMEHILAYAHMPTTFRPSMLARYQSRDEFLPSSILNPVLHFSGMYYEQFQMVSPRRLTAGVADKVGSCQRTR